MICLVWLFAMNYKFAKIVLATSKFWIYAYGWRRSMTSLSWQDLKCHLAGETSDRTSTPERYYKVVDTWWIASIFISHNLVNPGLIMQINPDNYRSRPPLPEVVPATQANPSLHRFLCFIFQLFAYPKLKLTKRDRGCLNRPFWRRRWGWWESNADCPRKYRNKQFAYGVARVA